MLKFKKIILLFMLLLFIIAICPIKLQNDTLFDIELGKKYTEQGMYTVDTFSIHENLSYQTHHFLVNIFIYYMYSAFNFIGLHILQIILTCIIAYLLYSLNRRFLKSTILSYISLFLELLMFSAFISLRAQMFSAIIFLVELLLINKLLYDDIGKIKRNVILFTLTVLPTMLINIHSGVIFFYYIIIVVYLCNIGNIKILRIETDNISIVKIKQLVAILFISLPLTLLNPYGIKGLTYMFKTMSNSFINMYISEFQPFNVKTNFGLYMLIYFSIHVFSFILSDRKITLNQLLFFCGTMFMSLLSIRHFIFYVMTTVVLLPHIESVLDRFLNWVYSGLIEKGIKAMKITICVILIGVYLINVFSLVLNKEYTFLPSKEYPIEITKYIKENIGEDVRIFNHYNFGSYLMFNDIKVFIDSRCDMYTKEYNTDINIAQDYQDTVLCNKYYEEIVAEYNVEYFLLIKDVPLVTMLLKDENYKMILEDESGYLIKRNMMENFNDK